MQVTRADQANTYGTLHGGEILKLADSVAGAVAHRHCAGQVVTRAIESATFDSPVEIGALVRATGRVASVGRTSLKVEVEVAQEPLYNAAPGPAVPVARLVFVMVALDPQGNPTPVPPLTHLR